jgi:RNA 3'-terminal phosphate cyclase (ATP)
LLPWRADEFHSDTVEATGPGNIVMISAEFEHVSELASGFGQRGVRAELVAMQATECWQAYEKSEAPVGEHLADQLLLLLAMAGRGSFSTMAPTLHTRTNSEVIAKFLDIAFRIEHCDTNTCSISLG